jgi:O-antigen/teichoic acid export membrane protein
MTSTPPDVEPPTEGATRSEGRFLGQAGAMAASRMLAHGFGLAGALLLARVLGPAVFGTLQGFKLLYQGAGLASLGILEGMAVRIPSLRARDPDRAELAAGTGLWAYLVLSAVGAAGLVLYAPEIPGDELWLRWGYALTVSTVVLNAAIVALDFVLTAREQIRVVASVALGRAATTFLTRLAGVWFLGPLVFWVAEWAASWTLIRLVTASGPRRLLRFSWGETREILRLGFPLYLAAQLAMIFSIADRATILGLLGAEALGHYAIGNTVSIGMMAAIAGVASVWSARGLRLLASGDAETVRVQTDELARGLAWASVVAAALASAVLCLLVPWLLPRYTPGLAPALALMPCLPIAAVGGAMGRLAPYFGWQGRMVPIAGLTALLGLALDFLAIHLGWGIVGVAGMTSLARLVATLTGTYLGWRMLGDSPAGTLMRSARLIFPVFILVAGYPVAAVGAASLGLRGPGLVLGATALFLGMITPALVGVWRDLDLATRARALLERLRSAPA